jgi:peptidoglycan/LPS O-acetylase OafA/YrhL
MRFKQIDVLRGLAALMVTLFHLTGNSGLAKSTAAYGSYGWLGVQLFFVKIGFVLPYIKYKNNYRIRYFCAFAINRLIKIYPAYLFAIIISVILAVITKRELISVPALFYNLFFLSDVLNFQAISPVLWTLAIEFQFYLLIGLLYPLLIKSNKYTIVILLVLSAISLYFPHYTILGWFPFFAVGILVFHRFFTSMPGYVFWLTLAFLIAFAFAGKGLLPALAALVAVVFIVFIRVERNSLLNRILLFTGAISYSLYLLHWELGRAAIISAKRLPFISGDFTKVIIGFAFSVFCAYLLYRFVERPSLKQSSKIKYKVN